MRKLEVIMFLTCLFLLMGGHYLHAEEQKPVSLMGKKGPVIETIQGSLVSVDLKGKFFKVVVDKVTIYFLFDKETKCVKDNKEGFLSDLLPGETLEVTYMVKGKKKIAKSIRAESSRLLRNYRSTYMRGY